MTWRVEATTSVGMREWEIDDSVRNIMLVSAPPSAVVTELRGMLDLVELVIKHMQTYGISHLEITHT